jgi:hypothetical protein
VDQDYFDLDIEHGDLRAIGWKKVNLKVGNRTE